MDTLHRFRIYRSQRDTDKLISLCSSLVHKTELQRRAGQAAGIKSGEARRAAVANRNRRILEAAEALRKANHPNRDVADCLSDQFNLSARQIRRILK